MGKHAQVFMLRGVTGKCKQPVSYKFIENSADADDTKHTIKEIVQSCQEIGFRVIAIVCDQGTNNVKAIKDLVKKTKATYEAQGFELVDNIIEINGESIVPLFDTPIY